MKRFLTILTLLLLVCPVGAQFEKSIAFKAAAKVKPSMGSASFARIQFKHGYVATAVTLDGSVTSGNCIMVAVSSSAVAATGCGDGLGNTYTLVKTQAGSGGFVSVFAGFLTHSGSCTVTETGASGDIGLTAVEFSGPTAVDTSDSASGVNPSLSLVTDATTMFFAAYENETLDLYTSSALNPGSVTGTVIQRDAAHIDIQVEWLNGANGFSAGSYTLDLTGVGAWVGVALK
jgi:hypothetical protein